MKKIYGFIFILLSTFIFLDAGGYTPLAKSTTETGYLTATGSNSTPTTSDDNTFDDILDLRGGVVTEVENSRFMTGFKEQDIDFETIMEELQDVEKLFEDYSIVVSKDGKEYRVPLVLDWNYEDLDTSASTFLFRGQIIPPDGCTFADGVLREVVLPYRKKVVPDVILLDQLWTDGGEKLLGFMIPLQNTTAFEDLPDMIQYRLTNIFAYNNQMFNQELNIKSLDISSIHPETEGTYYADVKLEPIMHPDDKYSDRYHIKDELLSLQIAVKVSDPSNLNVWCSGTTNQYLQMSWVFPTEDNLKLMYIESDKELSYDTLEQANWQPWNGQPEPDQYSINISRYDLIPYHHYYFLLQDGELVSNILYVMDDGNNVGSNYLDKGGDRDGSNSNGNPPGNVTQPAPTPPPTPTISEKDNTGKTEQDKGLGSNNENTELDHKNFPGKESRDTNMKTTEKPTESPANHDTDTTNSLTSTETGAQKTEDADSIYPTTTADSSSMKYEPPKKQITGASNKTTEESISVPSFIQPIEADSTEIVSTLPPMMESFRRYEDIISGTRLWMMVDFAEEAVFSKEGITVAISKAALAELSIKNEDSFSVTIKPESKNSFFLTVAHNDNIITHLPGTRVEFPYTAAAKDPELWVYNELGEQVAAGDYDSQLKIVTFIINETGAYTIEEKSASAEENLQVLPALPLFLSCIIVSAVGILIHLHRKRKERI